jgi:E3 ubiquitin-protein ligase listerin
LISIQINIYPRTSIDNARRVRQLAHSLQGFFTRSSGKRIAPYLSKVIGAWLSGAFDTDRSVCRAALESFEAAFPSEEKRKVVWKLYRGPLLEHVQDAALRHSPQTLSDERNTSPDDAEAKYVRVVSTALLALDRLLQTDLQENDLSSNETFQSIINAKKIGDLASHQDPSMRKSVYKLMVDVVHQGIQLDWKQLSSCFLAKSLHISQLGSSVQYIDVLLAITTAHASVWSSDYASKTTASARLCQYLRKGSQRGPEVWWTHVRQLIMLIPTQVWSTDVPGPNDGLSYNSARQLLNALHEGVVTSDEPRQNSVAAWRTYADIFYWTFGMIHDKEEKEKLVQAFLYPIIERYLLASSELSQWAVPLSISLDLSSSSMLKLDLIYPSNRLAAFYQSQVDSLIESMRLSQPESSKNFKASQNDIVQKACHFMDLQIAVETSKIPVDNTEGADVEARTSDLSATFIHSNIELLREAIKLLRDRNGKPYGAAALICIFLDKRPRIIDEIGRSPTPHLLSEFLDEEAPKLLGSPSAESLISVAQKCRDITGSEKSFGTFVEHFLVSKLSRGSRAYSTLLRGITNEDLIQYPDLRQQLLQDLSAALDGDDSLWNIVYEILTNQNLNQPNNSSPSPVQPIQSQVLEDMLSGLALEDKEEHALKGFDILLNRDPSLRPLLASHLNLGSLLTRLLLISDSPNEDKADRAARLASLVKKVFAKQGEIGGGTSAVEIVSRQLDGDGEAISILSLVHIAQEALQEADEESASHIASELCPSAAQWQKALTPFTQLQPPPSMSLISRLQGCAFAVDRQRRWSSGGLPRDSEGFSVALRLTILVTRLLEKMIVNQLPDEQLHALYLYYPQVLQLANDKLSIESANALWIESTEEVVQEVADTVANGQRFVHSWIVDGSANDSNEDRPKLVDCWLAELSNMQGTSAQAYNLARSFTTIMSEASDLRGCSRYMSLWDSSFRETRSSPDIMRSAALLAVCRETLATSALGKRLCNELVADATEVDLDLDEPTDGMYFCVIADTASLTDI